MNYSNKTSNRTTASAKVGTRVLSSQTISAINVLRMSTEEVTRLIDKYLEENLYLKRDEPCSQAMPGDWKALEIVAATPGFSEHVYTQILSLPLNSSEQNLALIFFEYLDEKGLLPDGICNDLSEKAHDVLIALQKLDPAGVFGCGIGGSLRLQLKREGEICVAMNAVLDNLAEFETGGIERLSICAGLDCDTALECMQKLKMLNPWPSFGWDNFDPQAYVAPEVAISFDESGVSTRSLINLRDAISIDVSFADDIRLNCEAKLKERFSALKDGARTLLSALELRHDTILKIALYIGAQHRQFLLSEENCVSQISMREVADQIGLHESTVSRAVRGVYAKTPRGTFELRSFFRSKTQSADIPVSNAMTTIPTRILELIRDEIVPLSDAEISSELAELGTKISRRTVAKYRSSLGVPPMGERLAGQTSITL